MKMFHKAKFPKMFPIFSLMITAVFATNLFMNINSQCGSPFVVFHRDHGYALIGHVIKSLSLFIADCQHACETTLECFSFNHCRFPNGTFVCELNRSNKKQNPGSYVPKEGYQYSEPTEMKYCDQQGCLVKEALPGGWYRLDASLYKLVRENKTWTDARQHCQSLGGDLVSFLTEMENTFVLKTLLWSWYTPLARYKMDGTDQNLSLLGGAAVVNIDNTKAVYFDGVDDQATIPRVDILTTDFTIAVWIKPVTPWGWVNTLIEDFKNGEIQFTIYFYYGGLTVNLHNSDNDRIGLGQGGIPLDQWTHFSLTWNREQMTAKIFQDAIQKRSKTVTFQNIDLYDNPYPVWRIGARDGASNKYFHGWIRDLIVIPKALSREDIQKLKDGEDFKAWIGLNDITTEGLFQWSDGKPLTFTQTSLTADNTDARNCVKMVNTKEWFAKDCNSKSSFICKKKSE